MSSLKDIRIFLEQAAQELYAEPTVDDSGAVRRSVDSTDDQIDSFIIKFERDSIVPEEDLISESLKGLSLSALLEQTEEPDEPAAEDDQEDGDADQEVSPPMGSEDVTVDEPAVPPKPPLDIDSFTKRVARLIENFEVLLDVRTVIMNRSFNFLLENYDKSHVDEMKQILEEQFDFSIDSPSDEIEAPYAVGAYEGGTGGSGG